MRTRRDKGGQVTKGGGVTDVVDLLFRWDAAFIENHSHILPFSSSSRQLTFHLEPNWNHRWIWWWWFFVFFFSPNDVAIIIIACIYYRYTPLLSLRSAHQPSSRRRSSVNKPLSRGGPFLLKVIVCAMLGRVPIIRWDRCVVYSCDYSGLSGEIKGHRHRGK